MERVEDVHLFCNYVVTRARFPSPGVRRLILLGAYFGPRDPKVSKLQDTIPTLMHLLPSNHP